MKNGVLVPIVGSFAVFLAWAPRCESDISLFDYGLNQDGSISTLPDPFPAGSVIDSTTGLGTVRMTFTGAGPHLGIFFVDHELSESVNTFFNEAGVAVGAPSAGQSWEIDEPGFVSGDIYDNFLAGTLDNSGPPTIPDDVSMAMGFNFLLAAGETGIVTFSLTETQPSGFYLQQSDPDSGENVFFASSLRISGGGPGPEPGPIPEGNVVLGASVLGALTLVSAWRCRRHGAVGHQRERAE